MRHSERHQWHSKGNERAGEYLVSLQGRGDQCNLGMSHIDAQLMGFILQHEGDIEGMKTVGEVAKTFSVNPQTVRVWAEQFADYLSEYANPTPGETRHFIDDDLQVMALVAYMRGKGATFAEIKEALGRGDRALMMDIVAQQEDSSPPAGGVAAGAYLARVEDLAQMTGQLQGKLGEVEGERDRLAGALTQEQAAHAQTRERAATAEERARLLAEQGKAPAPVRAWWQWALIVILGLIAVLLVALVVTISGLR